MISAELAWLVSSLSSLFSISVFVNSSIAPYLPAAAVLSGVPSDSRQATLTSIDSPRLRVSRLGAWSEKFQIVVPLVAVVEDRQTLSKKAAMIASPPPINDSFGHCVAADASLSETTSETTDVAETASKATRRYQVRVNNHLVAEVFQQKQATGLAKRFQKSLKTPGLNPDALRPALVDGKPAGKLGETVLFKIDPQFAAMFDRSSDLIAIDWVNNLRIALGAAPIPLVEAQIEMYGLAGTGEILEGTASWYGPYFHNRETATGERFNQHALTAAHPSLPFDTYLKVTNLENQASIIVRINDRGPYWGDRSLDLSLQAARCIGSENPGVVRYEAVIMEPTTITQATAKPAKLPLAYKKLPYQVARQP